MKRYSYDAGRGGIAVIAAGPIFILLLALGAYVDQASRGAVPFGSLAGALPIGAMVLPLAVAVGGLIAALPVLLGAALLTALSNRTSLAASHILWIAVGGALPVLATIAAGADSPEAAALLGVTGAACAAMARRGLREA